MPTGNPTSIAAAVIGAILVFLYVRWGKPSSASELVDSALKIVDRNDEREADLLKRIGALEKARADDATKIRSLERELSVALAEATHATAALAEAERKRDAALAIADGLAVRLSAAEADLVDALHRIDVLEGRGPDASSSGEPTPEVAR